MPKKFVQGKAHNFLGILIILIFIFINTNVNISKADTGDFILSGGPNPTDNICVDDDIYVYLNDNLIYSDIDPYVASCNNSPISFEANSGDELRIKAIDSAGFCRAIYSLWLHYNGQSIQLDPGKDDGCGWPAGVTFYDKTFVIPALIKEVPLYTQVRSPYPSLVETEKWFDLEYARGFTETYTCGSKIYQCGCAITSIVMIARYYLDSPAAQGKDINPKEINDWLKTEPGGYVNGDVDWIAAARYTGNRIKYEKTDKIINNRALLEEKLNNNQPVIAKANAGRGGINRQHFFVIDGKLAPTYTVKDPAWYNTKNLADNRSGDYIRNYENGFDGLRIYKRGDGITQSAITIALGSPADLLITDSLGRKLGKDANGIEYSEIPEAWYFEDGFDDPTGENPPSQERNKLIQILGPLDGDYQLEVIGIGEGSYSLESNFYDTQGNVNHQKFLSETAAGYTAQYNFSFDSFNSGNTIIELFDEIPPEAEVYFNPNVQQLEIKGADDTTVRPVASLISTNKKQLIYQIQDEAGNIAKLVFEKIKQEGKEIKAEPKAIQYNNEPTIEFSETELKYEWSIDKQANQIKELEQRIKVKDIFDIKAKYNHQKDETKIKIKQGDRKESEQTLPGLIIIKLITKSGVLNFDY